MDISYLNNSNYIKFNAYNYMTECTIGNSVILHNDNFSNKYAELINLKSGDTPTSVTSMNYTYYNCRNLTGSPVCGPNVINMNGAYYQCTSLTGSPVCGPNVTDMCNTYRECYNLTGSPVCGDSVTSLTFSYWNCYRLTGNPVCGPNVKYMIYTYWSCRNITGSPVCGPNVISMYSAYSGCRNITGNPVCGPNVTNMSCTYSYCYNLTGSPVCGDNVTDMSWTYRECVNLTGNLVCGDKVTNMAWTYSYLKQAKDPVCGPNVIDMHNAYYACSFKKDTLTPVCGNNVINMAWAYAETGKSYYFPVCGPNVISMDKAYFNAHSAYGNMYMYSNNVSTMNCCFMRRLYSNRLNIYVTQNSTSFNTCIINNTSSMFGTAVTWSNNGVCYYNTKYNTYIYPVVNVTQSKLDNGDYENDAELEQALIDFTYQKDPDGYYHITGWKQTYKGNASTECVLPNSNRIII